jgi:CubicO group peptidase (beta-lactamase class C family)
MYAAPEEAGWSSSKLDEARKFSEQIGSAAVMVVHDGAVLAAWGDVERRFLCHSMRKSFLSALYGIHLDQGTLRRDATLRELDIDDEPPLTEKERAASVMDLLASRSGVYHPAAYETKKMKQQRPARDSREPGEVFWYNNWDFNALCTIFETKTGKSVFQEFQSRLAVPTGMEDFRLTDCYYHLELEHSRHPAYPFRMSTRDLARFGLLFLRQGKWRDRQILPAAWVSESTRSHLRSPDESADPTYGYGLLWWPAVKGPFTALGLYSARGVGGHAIDVLPGANLVVVHRVDTFWDLDPPFGGSTKRQVTNVQRLELLRRILDARTGEPSADPRMTPLRTKSPPGFDVTVTHDELSRYAGTYDFGKFSLDIVMHDGCLMLRGPQMGTFPLQPRSPLEFTIEDIEAPARFEFDANTRPLLLHIEASPEVIYRGRPAGQ